MCSDDIDPETDTESDPDYEVNVYSDEEELENRNIQEEAESNISIFEEDSDSESSDEDIGHESQLSSLFCDKPFCQRRRDRNICDFSPQNKSHPNNEKDAFSLFVTDDILLCVQRYTNRKALDIVSDLRLHKKQVYNYMKIFTADDILACLGLLLYAGTDRDNFTAVQDLWSPEDGKPIFRATMSLKRFLFFLRTVRFDNYRDRKRRQTEDRLAAISEIWNLFNQTLIQHYIPADILTVDEQLLGYRGQIPGRTYIPTKPRKYGLKIFWLCEAASGFALNSKIYSGKEGNTVHRELGKHVVLQLCKPFEKSGRDIVTDNFFTSHSLAVELLQKKN